MRSGLEPSAALVFVLAGSLHPRPVAAGPASPGTEHSSAEAPPVEVTTPAPGADQDPDEQRASPGTPVGAQDPVESGAVGPADLRAAEAERHFIEASALFAERKYKEAAAEFRRSYASLATPTALYNMGLAQERAGDAVAAVHSYRGYLDFEGLSATRRAEVSEVLRVLLARLGEIALVIPEGVQLREIRVDQRVVPAADFPILVIPGQVTVDLFGLGALEHRARTYEVDGGQRLQIEVLPFDDGARPAPGVTPGPEGAQPVVMSDAARRERQLRVTQRFFWAGLVLTGAGGVTVGVLGGLAKQVEGDFNDSKCPQLCTEDIAADFPYRGDLERRAVSLQTATNVAIGITSGLALTTAVVGILSLGRRPRKGATSRLTPAAGGVSVAF